MQKYNFPFKKEIGIVIINLMMNVKKSSNIDN